VVCDHYDPIKEVVGDATLGEVPDGDLIRGDVK
jgi:hypothetical protein